MTSKRLIFPMTIIILACTALRLYQINSIPAGLHYDVAANAILVEEIAFRGQRPWFIEAYAGKEVLFFYSAALLFRVIGSSVFALRLAAAIWGILVVPVTFFAVRQVFRHEKNVNWIAALCSALVAFSFMHLIWSRFGMRAITQPVMQALALGFLYRGLRRSTFTDLALAGLFTGVSLYTYLAARAFPIIIVIALATYIIFHHRQQYLRVAEIRSPFPTAGLSLFATVTILTLVPLGFFFLEHPQTFLARILQISIRQGESALLWPAFTRALGMLFVSGEPYDRFNIPGKPILDPILGALFIIGLSVTIWRLIRQRNGTASQHQIEVSAEIMLLVWVPIFLLPTALAIHEIFPSNVRAFGLIPLVFVYPARGLLAISEWVREKRAAYQDTVDKHSTLIRPMIVLSILSVLTFTHTGYEYFYVWAKQDTQHIANDGDLAHVSKDLNDIDLVDTNVYMSALHYRHPTVAYLATNYNQIRWLVGAESLAIPDEGAALYLFPQSALPPDEWLRNWGTALTAKPFDPNGNVDYYAYHFDATETLRLPEFRPVYTTFSDIIDLTGYRMVGLTEGIVTVDLHFKVQNAPDLGDYRIVVDLVDQWSMHWSQTFNDSYPSEQWQPGETIIARVEIPFPVGTPPGTYTLAVTIYSAQEDRNLPATNMAGITMAHASIGPIAVPRAVDFSTLPQTQHSADTQLGELTLFGYNLHQTAVRPGDHLLLDLYWKSDHTPSEDLELTLILGEITIETGDPVHGTYPTTKWEAGEIVIDQHIIRLPRDITDGEHLLSLSMSDSRNRSASIELGHITVGAIERVLTAPTPSQSTDINLGDWVNLMGYDLETYHPLLLRLHWKSLAETDTDYAIFVHVRDANDQIVAQHDSGPFDGSYPTSLWIAGEFVSDSHSFDLPSGQYSIAVGMYVPTSGIRLNLQDGQDQVLIHNVVIP